VRYLGGLVALLLYAMWFVLGGFVCMLAFVCFHRQIQIRSALQPTHHCISVLSKFCDTIDRLWFVCGSRQAGCSRGTTNDRLRHNGKLCCFAPSSTVITCAGVSATQCYWQFPGFYTFLCRPSLRCLCCCVASIQSALPHCLHMVTAE
jgi:hypothetical protein